MAKGWTVLKTVNDVDYKRTEAEKKRSRKSFDKAIKKAEGARLKDVSKDLERLKIEGEDLYCQRINKENSIVDAYNDKRLKSKDLIKQAQKIVKNRAEAEKKKKKETPDKQAATTEQTA